MEHKKLSLAETRALYEFLAGTPCSRFADRPTPTLSSDCAWSVIQYLQEVIPVIPSEYKRCSRCDQVFDSNAEGTVDDGVYCKDCMPNRPMASAPKIRTRQSYQREEPYQFFELPYLDIYDAHCIMKLFCEKFKDVDTTTAESQEEFAVIMEMIVNHNALIINPKTIRIDNLLLEDLKVLINGPQLLTYQAVVKAAQK